MQVERGLGFRACIGSVSTAFAHLGEARMCVGAGCVDGDGRVKLLFCLGDQTLGEIVVTQLGVLRGLFGWGKRSHASRAHLVELKSSLTKRRFRIAPSNTLDGFEVRRTWGVGSCLCDRYDVFSSIDSGL